MDKTPKVLHFLFGGFGGQYSVVSSLSRELCRRGYDSEALLYAKAEDHMQHQGEEEDFSCVTRVERVFKFDVLGGRRIREAIRASSPDVIVWHNCYAAPSLLLLKKTNVFSQLIAVEHTSYRARSFGDRVRSINAALISNRVVFQSERELERAPARFAMRLLGSKAVIIPNGFSLPTSAVTDVAPGPATHGEGDFNVLVACRLAEAKDLLTFLQAVAILKRDSMIPQLKVRIAGTGPLEHELRAAAARLDLEGCVTFLGFLPESAVHERMRQCDVFVHPTRGESISMSILEAAAFGKPIVSNAVPGIIDMLTDGDNAILVPVGDPDSLALAIRNMFEDPQLRQQLGSAASDQLRERFDADSMVVRYVNLIDSVLR